MERDRGISPCEDCKKYKYYPATADSPAEETCEGCEDNLWSIGGCMYYEEDKSTMPSLIEKTKRERIVGKFKQLKNCVAFGELPQVEDIILAKELVVICDYLEEEWGNL